MSKPWKKCVKQKRDDYRCVCVRIIHRTGDAAARTAGINAAQNFQNMVSSKDNVSNCCPFLRVSINFCTINAAAWTATIVPAIGADNAITSDAEAVALDGVNPCLRPNCINLTMLTINMPNTLGLSDQGPPGNSAIDPTASATDPSIGAHELGHTLGLGHDDSSPNNIMHTVAPGGTVFSESECQTIWQNLGSYPCS